MKEILERVHIVLVEPKNAGNIGSVVRAMKNMGLSRLHLVNPVPFRDEAEQRKMGYRSQEIIAAAREFTSLSDALQGISQVFLATAKKGKWKKDFLSPAQAAAQIAAAGAGEKIALVFGREDKGVTTDESQLANFFIRIPMAGTYPSLNLSQAVMVVAYEVYKAVKEGGRRTGLPRMAEKRAFERLTDNIWDLMKSLEVREPENGLFHRSLKRALSRTRWTNADVAVFDRFCKQVRWYAETRCRPAGTRKNKPMKFFNTLTRRLEEFREIEKGKIGLYTCGPTVYDYPHIGNYRSYVFEDLVKRFFLFLGYRVRHVMNITDIDDKTIRKANELGVPLAEVTQKYIDAFHDDLRTLNILPADVYPRATEHIPEMLKLIAVPAGKGIRLRKGRVGLLQHRALQGIRPPGQYRPGQPEAGRSRGCDADEYEKEAIQDFVLWKGKKPGEPSWPAPFGEGRPGLAHRVLGHEHEVPGAAFRHPHGRRGQYLPAP